MEQPFDAGNIQILEGLDAVRHRPTMYLGALDNVLVPNLLLREALCCARDEALQGRCKALEIRLEHDGRAIVSDDGPGLPLDMGPCGKRKAELYLTSLHAGCAAGKSSEEIARTTCVLTLAVLNALSSEVTVRIFADGAEWMQQYKEGKPVSKLSIAGTSTRRGTELSFTLDSGVLPRREFQHDEFVGWLKAHVKGLAVTLHDARTNEVTRLEAR